MKWFLNMKIGKKLVAAFVLTAMISGGMGLFALYNINKLAESNSLLYNKMTVPLGLVGELSTDFQRIRIDLRDMITAQSPEDIQKRIDKIKVRKASIAEKAGIFEKGITTHMMQKDFDAFMASNAAFYEELDKVIKLAEMNDDAAALEAIREGSMEDTTAQATRDAIQKMIDDKQARAEEIESQNISLAKETAMITIILSLMVFLISVSLGILLSRLVANPLKKALHMMNGMSMGHFSQRLGFETKDEVGQMARAMDAFSDVMQNKVITAMNAISAGRADLEIVANDAEDEIAPALKNTMDMIKNLNTDIKELIQSAIEGKLDRRGDASRYEGSWKKIIVGFNATLDAIIGPLNVAAAYVDRISKGEIPDKITDEYKGDFNELKNNLNACIDAVGLLVEDSSMLADAAMAGDLAKRADAGKHQGDFRKVVEGFNGTLDTVVDKAVWYEAIIDAIPFPIHVTDMDMKWTYMNKAFEKVMIDQQVIKNRESAKGMDCYNANADICNTDGCGIRRLVDKGIGETFFEWAGKSNKQDTAYLKNRFGENVGFVEVVTDLTQIMRVSRYTETEVHRLEENLKRLAAGNIDFDINIAEGDEYTAEVSGQFNAIGVSLSEVRLAVGNLISDASGLANAAIRGELENRVDIKKHSGEFAKIMEGLNDTLDAVSAPINEVTAVMNTMSQGILSKTITGEYRGEFKELADSVNSTINSLRAVVGEISHVIEQIAGGNLALEYVREYRGDYAGISNSLNTIIESLNSVLTEINNAADQVTIGAKQVSDGSQALSQGATEQASSLEELNASITEIASMTKGNAASANQANEMTLAVKGSAEEGSRHMDDMLRAMQDISESSNNISKIIKVIDDIAFQTNILALNAAVEAARAGQHGKGFAVVAEEVRSLAARSAAAAKDTTALIQGSIQKSSAGTGIAHNTAAALSEIVGGVTQTAEIIASIARSSNEQAMGVTQINTGLNQVSQVVQNNAATAEESAASSEELSSQSEILKGMVERFKLRNGSGSNEMLRLNAGSSPSAVPKSGNPSKSAKIMLDFNDFDKY